MRTVESIRPHITYDDYLLTPEIELPYEIIDGKLVMTPAPTSEHQWISTNIFVPLSTFVRERKLGVVLYAPVDIVIQRDPLRTRQPDILFLSSDRIGSSGRETLRKMPVIEVPPDLIVEILSPTNTRLDVTEKLEDYRQIGVRECWLVSPEAETVEVLRCSANTLEVVGLFGRGTTIRSEVLEGFTLDVEAIFA
jgi:Uma2 family endonuclease